MNTDNKPSIDKYGLCLNEYKNNTNNATVYYNRAIGKFPEMETSKAMAKIIKKIAMKDDKILDVGCASGHFLRSLRRVIKKKFFYTGIDPYEIFLRKARKAWKNDANSNFIKGNIYNLPIKRKQFDISYSSNVFIHLNDIEKPLRELFRVTKKTIIIRTVLYEVSYKIQLVYNNKWWKDINVKPENEFDKKGNPRAYSFFNIHSKDYFLSLVKKINKNASVELIKDNFFSKKNINKSIKDEKRPLATRIINGEQFSGCIMQPHYFIVIKK